MESVHAKLERVRKPRVHIKYEVETEGAMVVKELPFVVGVLGDFSGDPTQPLKPFGERKFVQVDRDNFDDVMRRMTPGVEHRGGEHAPERRHRPGGLPEVRRHRGLRAGRRRRTSSGIESLARRP